MSRLPERDVPPPVLRHLWRLTDGTGLVQHATFDVPNLSEGYCTDDNARALTLMVLLDDLGERTPEIDRATTTYAAFLGHAFDPVTGRFRNFLGFDRRWLDERGSDDCLGRAVLALGTCIGRSRMPNLRRWAARLFEPAVQAAGVTTSPRAWACAVLGLQEYLQRLPGDRLARTLRDALIDRLLALHRSTATPDWPWFEDVLTYDNARPCQALIAGGRSACHTAALGIGLAMLDWLGAVQRSSTGRFAPVGSRGFHRRGGTPAAFDQQPIEAHATIAACAEAYRATGDGAWLDRAWNAFDWFHGLNVLGVGLCDPHTGACRDGLHEDRANENQGAESTLAYLGAVVEMRLLGRPRPAGAAGVPAVRPDAAATPPCPEPPPCP